MIDATNYWSTTERNEERMLVTAIEWNVVQITTKTVTFIAEGGSKIESRNDTGGSIVDRCKLCQYNLTQ